jgi:predicted DNA-binding transcriptional regulator YafY
MIRPDRVDHILLFSKIVLELQKRHLTAKQLSKRFDMKLRTVYRYIESLQESDVPIEQDFEGRWFIVSDKCLFCGNKMHQHELR